MSRIVPPSIFTPLPDDSPPGRSFTDPDALRQSVYDSTLNAVRNAPPVSTPDNKYSLRIGSADYSDPDSFSPRKQKEAVLSGGTLSGLIGSEKEGFFNDPRLAAILQKNGLRVQVEKAGSRAIAQRGDRGERCRSWRARSLRLLDLSRVRRVHRLHPARVPSEVPVLRGARQGG